MEMKKMTGGNLRSAGFDERDRKLVVELTAGTFEYSGVTLEVWRRFSTASSPKAKHRIAASVYGPTPGRSVRSWGQPLIAMRCAARCRLSARRLYPSPCHLRMTSAVVAAASEPTVGHRSSQAR